jgi:hypothetical protein
MASTYSDLGLELMVTGENAGTWGDKTNTNLNLVQQAIAGYEAISIAGGVGTTTLAMTDATISNARNAVIKFTGTITGNRTVTIPDGIEKTYLLENGTTGSFTVAFKTVSGTGVTFSTTDKGFKQVFSDGTNVVDVPLGVPGGSNTEIQFNNSASFGGSANLVWDGSNFIIGAQGDLRLSDTTGGEYVGLQAPGTVSASYTLTLPAATGTADQILVTDGSGNLSFVDNSGGTAWAAVKTAGFTAVAGEGYFCDTTSAAFTMTLPAGTLGDEISFIDYAGTFDTYALTIAPDGAEKIQGTAASLTVSVERAANTLVYTDGTQGWLLKAK